MSVSIKKSIPYIIPPIVFYLLTIVYFSPSFFQNKKLAQTDIVQFEGMSHQAVDYYHKTGEPALWNDAMFSGMPDYLISTPVPAPAIDWIKRFFQGFMPKDSSAQLLMVYLMSFWVLLLCFEVNPWLACIGAIAFGFNSYNIINIVAGHFTKSWAIAFSAIVIGGMRLIFKKKLLLGLGVFALGLALEIRADHYQITYYLVFVCLAYAISELIYSIKAKEIKPFIPKAGILLIGVVLGASVSTGKLIITKEFTPYTIRGENILSADEKNQGEEGLSKDYAFSWSQGKMETLTLLIPSFYGGSSHEILEKDSHFYKEMSRNFGRQQADRLVDQPLVPLYRGDQPFTAGPLYAGGIICFLFILAMLLLKGKHKWWILSGFILMLVFSWGRNLSAINYLLFDYLPGFNKFRSVSMALSLALLLMSLASVLVLDKLLKVKWDKLMQKKLLIAFGSTAGVCLLFILFAGMIDSSVPGDQRFFQSSFGLQDAQLIKKLTSALEKDRVSYLRMDAFRSFAFISLSLGLLFFLIKEKIKPQYAVLGLGVLILVDLWGVDKRYLNKKSFQSKSSTKRLHKLTDADKRILEDKSIHYRVLNLSPNAFREANTSYYHNSIGGYFAAKLRRYQDLIDNHLFLEQQKIANSLSDGKTDFSNIPVMNMLNAKYIKFGDKRNDIIVNSSPMGNAWFIEELKTATSPDDEMHKLGGIDPTREAIIEKGVFEGADLTFSKDSLANIELTFHSPREIKYKSNNSKDGFAVFSEIHYPKGWKAFIDGKETTIYRVNYALRGLKIPEGNHEIKFQFNPSSYKVGSTVTYVSSWITVLIFFGSIIITIRKRLSK